MWRYLAQIICLAVAAAVGWVVDINFRNLFDDYTPHVSGVGVLFVVFAVLYFPLMRPIADVLSDRVAVALHRGRHIRSGSGLEEIPETPEIRCVICGTSGAPMCPACRQEIENHAGSSKPT